MATKKTTETRIRKTRPAPPVPPPTTLAALLAVKEIADTEGLGDTPASSERAYRLVCQAIANTTGQPCTGLAGSFHPEVKSAQTLQEIAMKHLFIDTLETRNSDELDFHDLSVWAIRSALEAAYQAGKAAR